MEREEANNSLVKILKKIAISKLRKVIFSCRKVFGCCATRACEKQEQFSVFRRDVVSVFYFIERLKNEENQNDVDVDLIERLKEALAFICTYLQLSYCDLEQFDSIMTFKRQEVRELIGSIDRNMRIKYNIDRILTRLRDNIDVISCHLSKSSAAMPEEQFHFLLQNLHHLSEYHAEKIFPLVREYEILHNLCGSIKDFHGLIVNGCIEHEIVEYVLPQFQPMADRVGHFLWGVLIDGESCLFALAHLFLKIIPIELEVVQICFTNLRASTLVEVERFIKQLLETSPNILREYLIHLQEHMINVINPGTLGARNIHVMIEFLLIILTDMPKNITYHDKVLDLLARVGALTREVSILGCNLEEDISRVEESTNEINRATMHLLENIQLLKGDLKNVYLKTPVGSSQLRSPMSDGSLFMHLLLRHLMDLLNSNAYSVALMKEEIELVKNDLELVKSFFVNVEQHHLYEDLQARVLDVAYETKDVIDSIIVRDNGLLHLIFSLPVAIGKIQFLKEEVSNLSKKIPKNIVNSPNKQPIESKSSVVDGKIFVGFKEEIDFIIKKLTNKTTDFDVISIVGMPGAGKTTLAYTVYNDKLVSSHFDIRVWCIVGQDHEKLLEKIYNQVIDLDSKVYENVDDVADKLRKHLFGKRYLIVLDDLWDTDTWDELIRAFPRIVKGSRIILTTRDKKVALHGKWCDDPLYLRFLRQEEVWELLEKRVFGEENRFPNELLDVGKEIVKNCKGLPLVADLIVGVLAMKEKKRIVWLEVLNNLNSVIFKNEVDVMKVIELSYNLLADHLKLCLLYLASWNKDTVFTVFSLKALWHCEGLVERTNVKSMEEVAEVYLDNLISSSLVLSFSEIGDFQTVQVHDLVHDFCLIKAKEEKFFDLISSSAPSSSSDLIPRRMSINYDEELFMLHPHLHDSFVLFDSEKNKHSGKHLYSLEIDGNKVDNRLSGRCHLRHLRLLKVLTLYPSFIKVQDFLLNEICMLAHLRFLYIGVEVKSLPSCFSNLWNLEALVLMNRGSPMVLLPAIWNLVKLGLLSINDCCFFDLDNDESILVVEDTKLENLRIFGGLQLSHWKDTDDIFKRFPNLQQLNFSLMESSGCSTKGYWFPKLDFLNELEILQVTFLSGKENSNTYNSGSSVAVTNLWDFHFPSSLKDLKLFNFPLTVDSLATIARLPNLEVFHFVNATIEGEEWNMGKEETFKNLKRLRLEGGNLAKWIVGEETFPMLEQLILENTHKLEEIPPTFADIDSLKSINLARCPPHLEESALKIKQDVENITGNDKLKVLVLNES